MKKTFVLMLMVGAMLLAACQPLTPVTPAPGAGIDVTLTPGSETPSAAGDEMARLSTAFLGEQFKIAAGAVTVKEVTPMTWPDASLGCPRIGVMYIQVVTPGYQVVLDADGHTFTFHTDAKDRVVLCKVNPPDAAYPTPGM